MITKFYGKKRPKSLLIKVVYYNLVLNLIILDVTAQNSYPTSLMGRRMPDDLLLRCLDRSWSLFPLSYRLIATTITLLWLHPV